MALLRHYRLQSRHQRHQGVLPASVSASLCGGTGNAGLQMGTFLYRSVGSRPGSAAWPGLSSSGHHCAIDEGSMPRCGSCLVPLLGHEHRYRLFHLPHPDAIRDQFTYKRQAEGSSVGHLWPRFLVSALP